MNLETQALSRLSEAQREALLGHAQTQVLVDPPTDTNAVALVQLVRTQKLYLTDTLPVLQNFGLKVIDQSATELSSDGQTITLDTFRIDGLAGHSRLSSPEKACLLAEGLTQVFASVCENDPLNRLVLGAGLSWRQVSFLRAWLAYARQLENIPHDFMRRVLLSHPEASRLLIGLFVASHDPGLGERASEVRQSQLLNMRGQLQTYLKEVESAAEDRVLRLVLRIIEATLRTNAFRRPMRPFVSFKLDSERALPGQTGLRPWREIFVYHPAVEGIHLRGGPTARGGLRWSDRHDDYRSEILDLMRTQMTKNVLIVPVGAKGGFILKQQAPDRHAERKLADQMYQTFIRGLLDVTDNIVAGHVVPPAQVVLHDEEDPYLVVAADKGTAHLSDTANRISQEYGFWLDDAFASGGSNGYDHKKEAITAKGGWECVKRHFWDLGLDPEQDPITAIGIGDMSGDVFGNGLLLSKTLKLRGAFNHANIFLDPEPNPTTSFEERLRLFNLPGSTWEHYNPELISAGGGVFKRSAKAISLTPPLQKLLGTDAQTLSGEQVIYRLLQCDVDLLWSGGIGTYVKASSQTHAEVGDRINDAVRVDATQLRARVVGEGGNLGFTQAARVEFALRGGRLNTDAVDNSGGVDMSDHEVNLKILFQALIASGALTREERNQLLLQMTPDVSESVLAHNRGQSLLLSLDGQRCLEDHRPFGYLMEDLFNAMKLDRRNERLPSNSELAQRFEAGQGLTRPELARLAAFTKMRVRGWLQRDARLQTPYIEGLLLSYFPAILRERFATAIKGHKLRQDIIATVLTSRIIDMAGMTFFQEIYEDTGHTIAEVAMAYLVSADMLGVPEVRNAVLDPSLRLPAAAQYRVLLDLEYGLSAHCRRTLRRGYNVFEPEQLISRLKGDMLKLREQLLSLLPPRAAQLYLEDIRHYVSLGLPEQLARQIASYSYMASASDIVQLKEDAGLSLADAAWVYHAVAEETRVRSAFEFSHRSEPQDRWEGSAMTLLRGRLLDLQYRLAVRVGQAAQSGSVREALAAFVERHAAVIARLRVQEQRLIAGHGEGVAAVTVLLSVAQELNS